MLRISIHALPILLEAPGWQDLCVANTIAIPGLNAEVAVLFFIHAT